MESGSVPKSQSVMPSRTKSSALAARARSWAGALQFVDVAPLARDSAVLVEDPDVEPQVFRHARRPEFGGRDRHATVPREPRGCSLEERTLLRRDGSYALRCDVRRRDELTPGGLGQRTDRLGQPLRPPARDAPLGLARGQLGQERQRHLDRGTVVPCAGLEAVLDGQRVPAQLEHVRELPPVHGGRVRRDDVRSGEAQQTVVPGRGLTQPALERRQRVDALGDSCKIEVCHPVLVQDHAAAPELGLLALQGFPDPRVVGQELRPQPAPAVDQGFPHEQAPRLLGRDAAVVDAPARRQRQAIERDRLPRRDVAALGLPFRVAVAPAHEVMCGGLDPFGVHGRDRACVDALRLGEGGRHDPPGRLVA